MVTLLRAEFPSVVGPKKTGPLLFTVAGILPVLGSIEANGACQYRLHHAAVQSAID